MGTSDGVGCVDLLLGTELGKVALCTIVAAVAGKLPMLECIFVLRCKAPPALQVQRFLPGAAIRLLIDERGRDLGARITRSKLNGMARGVPTAVAQDVIKHARPRIDNLLKLAHTEAEGRGQPQIEKAVDFVEETQSAELERLAALAEHKLQHPRGRIACGDVGNRGAHQRLARTELELDRSGWSSQPERRRSPPRCIAAEGLPTWAHELACQYSSVESLAEKRALALVGDADVAAGIEVSADFEPFVQRNDLFTRAFWDPTVRNKDTDGFFASYRIEAAAAVATASHTKTSRYAMRRG